MFEVLLILAVVVAVVLFYYFVRMGNNEKNNIVTKLEHLDESALQNMEASEFKCEIRHSGGKLDELEVHPLGPNSETRLGIIPYDYKGRILHFMNTRHFHYEASFNKEKKEITIDLVDELET